MLGYEPGALPPEYRSWADLLHPDDRAPDRADHRSATWRRETTSPWSSACACRDGRWHLDLLERQDRGARCEGERAAHRRHPRGHQRAQEDPGGAGAGQPEPGTARGGAHAGAGGAQRGGRRGEPFAGPRAKSWNPRCRRRWRPPAWKRERRTGWKSRPRRWCSWPTGDCRRGSSPSPPGCRCRPRSPASSSTRSTRSSGRWPSIPRES